jgi:hypothetical protein
MRDYNFLEKVERRSPSYFGFMRLKHASRRYPAPVVIHASRVTRYSLRCPNSRDE